MSPYAHFSFFQNLSVLESHHWRFAISCIRESGLFDHFSEDQWIQVCHMFVPDPLLMQARRSGSPPSQVAHLGHGHNAAAESKLLMILLIKQCLMFVLSVSRAIEKMPLVAGIGSRKSQNVRPRKPAVHLEDCTKVCRFGKSVQILGTEPPLVRADLFRILSSGRL